MPDATPFHFGVLTSGMHMAWVRQICGRLKSDFRYSSKLVYNNFPWPPSPSDKHKAAVESAAQGVLDARDSFKGQTLADLYDPLAMPKALRDAHRTLDRAVDRCYRTAPFTSERQRVEYLFDLYQKLTAPLTAPAKPARKPRRTAKRSTPPPAEPTLPEPSP
ncbi:MAG: type IIL restriction-modification enzyme MmeI [Phycisphaerales bacterium]